jgi:phosphoserine phosphatase
MDFHFSNELVMKDGLFTGEVRMPLGWERIGCDCQVSVCKRFHLEKAAKMYGVALDYTAAVGDTASDICMIRRANVGIAFDPKDDAVTASTNIVVRKPDLRKVLDYV